MSNTKPKSSSAPRPAPVEPKPEPRPPIVHQGTVGGPGSDNVQQKGWGGKK
jgi:hypothetical protein